MSVQRSTIVLGIGSPHGDDQLGWAVVDKLAACNLPGVQIRKVANPLDIVSELEAYAKVIIVDAAMGLPMFDSWMMLSWSDDVDRKLIEDLPCGSTHDLGISAALQMVEKLGKRTDHVTLWIGRGRSFEPMTAMSSDVAIAANERAESLAKELCDA